MGTDKPWTKARVDRLCRLLVCLPDELAALAAVPPSDWGQYLKHDRIPAPVALHFVGLERAYLAAKNKLRRPEPLIPVELLT